MKKNLLCIVLCFCVLMSLLLGACTSAEPSAMGQATTTTGAQATSGEETPSARKEFVMWNGKEDAYALYAKATDEQKVKLDALKIEEGGEEFFVYARKIKIIMGEIPEDTQRITLEQAETILKGIDPKEWPSVEECRKEILTLFNEIHGYADFFFIGTVDPGVDIFRIDYEIETENGVYKAIRVGENNITYVDNTEGGKLLFSFNYGFNYPPPIELWEESNWDTYYTAATPEQKKELDALSAEYGHVYARFHAREILMIMGELPEDTPRITLEQVKEILEEMKNASYRRPIERVWDFQKRMNEIHGNFDFDRIPSGEPNYGRIEYYLNDEGTQVIYYYQNSGKVIYEDTVSGTTELLVQFQ